MKINILSISIASIKTLFTPKTLFLLVLGSMIGSFGLYNIHYQSSLTEGGVLGAILLLNHWTGLPASILSPLLDLFCYAIAYRILGGRFLTLSLTVTALMAAFFRIWEQFPPLLPNLTAYPLIAAVLGALFIGIGTGLVVRGGGSGSGDDALALVIVKKSGWRISKAYLATDFSVLALSLTYLPLDRIFYSILTVTISSYLIDFISCRGRKKEQLSEASL